MSAKKSVKRKKPMRRPSSADRWFRRQQKEGDQDALAFADAILWFATKSNRDLTVRFKNDNGEYEVRTVCAGLPGSCIHVHHIPRTPDSRRVE